MSAARQIFCIDLRSLAAFRITIAIILLWDLWARSRDLEAHYTDAGVLPRNVLVEFFLSRRPYFSVHTFDGSAQFEALLFGVAALFAIALLVGYRTWIATAACWFLTCSLHARNHLIVHGGDDALRMLLFWSMFVPLGSQWSVDRTRASRVERDDRGVRSWGTAGLMLQLCFIYFFSATLKSHPSWRQDGTAVYLALSIDQFATQFGRALLPYHGPLKALTFGTLALEMAGPFFALLSYKSAALRMLTVCSFIAFHVGLALCIELGIFPAVCIAGWLAFIPGSVWDRLTQGVRRAAPRFPRIPAGIAIAVSRVLSRIRKRPLRLQLSLTGSLVAGLALTYILMWNVRASNYDRVVKVFPRELNVIGEVARIDQYWNLFAPYPILEHGWYVLYARLQDGEEVDLLTGKTVTWQKPPLVSGTYENERWRKYRMNLWMKTNSKYRSAYAMYLQRTWNRSRSQQKHIVHLEIYFVLENALPNYQFSPPQCVSLWVANWLP